METYFPHLTDVRITQELFVIETCACRIIIVTVNMLIMSISVPKKDNYRIGGQCGDF